MFTCLISFNNFLIAFLKLSKFVAIAINFLLTLLIIIIFFRLSRLFAVNELLDLYDSHLLC